MTQKKKIICTVTNDLYQDRRMHRVCQTLFDKGYDVTLVGRDRSSSLPLEDRDYKQVRLKVDYDSGPLFYYTYTQALKKYLVKEKPDILYSVDVDTLYAGASVKQNIGCKLIYDSHEYFSEVPELKDKWLKKSIWRWIEKRSVAHTDACITVGPALAEIFEEKYKKPYAVIRNVPEKREVLPSKGEGRSLLYQGVLNQGRFLFQYIDMMEFLPTHYDLKIVGGGDLEKELKRYAQTKNYRDRIQFLGWKTGDDLHRETSKAYLGLNLLEAVSLSYTFSLANKFFDYMHAGVPSLNSALPEYERIIETHEVGLVTSHTSPQQIAEEIMKLDNNTWSSMSQKALDSAKDFSWSQERHKLVSLVEEVIASAT